MSDLLFDQFLVPFFVRFFFLFGLLSMAVGLGLMWAPERMEHVYGLMNRWISTRRSLRHWESPQNIDAAIYRFGRRMWILLLLIVVYSTFTLITQIHAPTVVAALGMQHGKYAVLAEVLVQTVRWSLVFGELFVMLVGVLWFFFPQVLQTFERQANRWVSTHRALRGLDIMHMGFDAWVRSRPRRIGGLITAGALFVNVNFGIMWFAPV